MEIAPFRESGRIEARFDGLESLFVLTGVLRRGPGGVVRADAFRSLIAPTEVEALAPDLGRSEAIEVGRVLNVDVLQ